MSGEDELARFAARIEEELNSGFSDVVLDHAMNPRNVGRLENEDGLAVFTGPFGDTMLFSINVDSGIIRDARFWTDGCGTSIASGSMTTELAKGRSLDDAMLLEQADVLAALKGLPPGSEHCALLAATTLHMATEDYRAAGTVDRDGRS